MAGEITVGGNILASHTGIDGAGSLTLGNTVAPASSYMFRNRIINGNFDIWQRGTSLSVQGFCADRWFVVPFNSTQVTSQQSFTNGQTEVPGNPKFYHRMVVTSVAGSGNYVLAQQRIEGVDTLSGKTAKLSFWAKADANKNIATEFFQYFGTGGSPSSRVNAIGVTTHNLTTSWQKFTTTISIPSISGKTIGTDGNDFVSIIFWFEAGSDVNSRTNSLGQQSGTFDIAQVQLEEGSVATPFEHRPIGVELGLCQRYYFKTFNQATVPAQAASAAGALSGSSAVENTSFTSTMKLPVSMRTTPNPITTYSTSSSNSKWSDQSGKEPTASVLFVGENSVSVRAQTSIAAGGAHSIHFTAEAEL